MHQTAPSCPTSQCSFPINAVSKISQTAFERGIQPGQRQLHETEEKLPGVGETSPVAL